MRILYIITQADGGGAQNYTLALAKHFRGAIAAGDEANKLFDDAKAEMLQVYPLTHLKRAISPLHDFLAMWEIRQLIKQLQPDIVHLNSTKAGVLGSFAAIGLKTKVVFTAHGFIFNEPLGPATKAFYLALEKTASSYRDYIITVSDADKQSALNNKLISPDKISTIHNGQGTINFLPRDVAKSTFAIGQNKMVIGTVANFYKTKGLDVLVDAVAMLPDDIRERLQFVIIGDGNERANLQSSILNLKLSDVFILPGNIPNAKTYLKAFDLFVLPSRKEGFPYAILEAMAAGLPIIATNVGGIPEALGDAGMLIQPGNAKELTKAIVTIIHSRIIVDDLSKKALERAKLFTPEKMFSETEKVYERVLQK